MIGLRTFNNLILEGHCLDQIWKAWFEISPAMRLGFQNSQGITMFKAGPDFMVEGGKDWSCLKSMETYCTCRGRQDKLMKGIKLKHTQKKKTAFFKISGFGSLKADITAVLQWIVAYRATWTSMSRTFRSKQSQLCVVLLLSYGMHIADSPCSSQAG